jgi:DNA-directed RNA polymerase subunit RPC12/RpoP
MSIKFKYICPDCKAENLYGPQNDNIPEKIHTRCPECKKRIYSFSDAVNYSNQTISKFYSAKHPVQGKNSLQRITPTCMRNISVNDEIIEKQAQLLLGNFAEEMMFEVHALRFKLPLYEQNDNWEWQKETKMVNWIKKQWNVEDFQIEQTSSSIIVSILKKICSNDYQESINLGKKFVLEIATWLRQNGFQVGNKIKMIDKPHIVIPRKSVPNIAKLGVKFIVNSDGKFVIDDSKGKGNGEVEIISGLQKMDEIFDTPRQLKELAKVVVVLQDVVLKQQKIISNVFSLKEENKMEADSEIATKYI